MYSFKKTFMMVWNSNVFTLNLISESGLIGSSKFEWMKVVTTKLCEIVLSFYEYEQVSIVWLDLSILDFWHKLWCHETKRLESLRN